MHRSSFISDTHNDQKPLRCSVEIPVHITTSRPIDQSHSIYSSNTQNQNTPTIHISHDLPEDVEDQSLNADNAIPHGYSLNKSYYDFPRQNRGLSSRIPINKEKSFSTNNLCDPDLQFQHPQNLSFFPETRRNFFNHDFMNSPYSFNQYPYQTNMHQPLPTHPEFPEIPNFDNERNFHRPLYFDNINQPHFDYQHYPFQPDRFQQYRQPFESNWSTNFTHPAQPESFDRHQVPQSRLSSTLREPARNVSVQNERLARRRDSSEPPNISSREELRLRSHLNVLEQNVNRILKENTPESFDNSLKPQLINFVNHIRAKVQKDQQQWQKNLQSDAENILLKLAEFERTMIIALPYEPLSSKNQSIDNNISDHQPVSNQTKLEDKTVVKFEEELDRLSEWMQNCLFVQCNEFTAKAVKEDRLSIENLNRHHQYLQDQITKALCKCDAISGQSLSEHTRQRRKETVKSLEDMASKLDSHYKLTTSAFLTTNDKTSGESISKESK